MPSLLWVLSLDRNQMRNLLINEVLKLCQLHFFFFSAAVGEIILQWQY